MGGVAAHSSRRSILTKTANFKSNLKKYKPSTEYKRTAFPLEKTPQALLQYQNDKHQKEKGEEPFFAKGTPSS